MPFGPVDPDLDLPALEERVLARWREREVVEEVARLRKGAEPWIFYEGPPTANGRPGLHHVWARAFKDLFPRFQTMRGHDVPRKGGWDCHGLPVELEVEKELGLATKADIEAYGIEEFNQRCRESVPALRGGLVGAHGALGRVDRHRRRLLDARQRLHRVGLVAHAPALGQGPALRGPPGHALLRPLRHRAQLARGGPGLRGRRRPVGLRALPADRRGWGAAAPDADLLVWTTTPWTLISNVAAAVGPTSPTCGSPPRTAAATWCWASGPPAGCSPTPTVVERWRGADLVGWRYRRPFEFLEPVGWARSALAGGRRRLRERRRRLRHRPPGARLRRGRRPGRPGRGPAGAQPRRRRRHLRPHRGAVARPLRQGRRPRDHRRPPRAGACWWPSSPTSTATPTAGAAARRSSTGPRRRGSSAPRSDAPTCWPRTSASAGTRTTSSTAASGTGSRATSTGPCPATATGARRCRSGAAGAAAHDTCVGSVAELSELAGRDLSDLDLHRPYVDDDHVDLHRARLSAARSGACHRCSTPGSTRGRCRRPSSTTPSPTTGAFDASLPRRLHLRGHRPDAGLVLLAAGGQHAGVRLHAVPQRRVPRAHRRRARARRCRSRRATSSTPGRSSPAFGADALRWYFFSAGQPWTTTAGVPRKASASRPGRRC